MTDNVAAEVTSAEPGKLNARDAYDYAWNWFKYHAEQRLAMVRFAVLILGAIAAGVGYLHQNKTFFISVLLCIFGIIASYCFLKLDHRTADLIKLGEKALAERENEMAEAVNSETIKMFQHAESLREKNLGTLSKINFWPHKEFIWSKWRNYPYTYKQNFRLLFLIVISLYTIVGLYELTLYLRADPESC
jgi:hypothetical protein